MFTTHCPIPALKGYAKLFAATAILAFLMLPEVGHAALLQELPYEGGIKALHGSMTGTVPFIISLVGIIGCGAMLIFGGEISGFMRTMVFIVLVVAVIVQAGSLIGLLGGDGYKDPFTYVPASRVTDRKIA